MALQSYDAEKQEIVFYCSNCAKKGNDPLRVIAVTDLAITSQGSPGVVLPPCSCGAVSYILPGGKIGGPVSHMRALILKRAYVAAGGDANEALAPHSACLTKLDLSYSADCTEAAAREFRGEIAVTKVDKSAEPLRPVV